MIIKMQQKNPLGQSQLESRSDNALLMLPKIAQTLGKYSIAIGLIWYKILPFRRMER